MILYSTPPLSQAYKTYALTAVVSPVTAQELADWLSLDDNTHPVLNPILLACASYMIERLQSELIARDRVVIYQHFPTIGNTAQINLGQTGAMREREIKLPYARLLSVSSVELYGGAYTDYVIQQTTPATLFIEDIPALVDDYQDPAIAVQYEAGFGALAADVPEVIRVAITMMAAYMFAHRGACDAVSAFGNSGARELVTPYMAEVIAI